MTTPSAAGWAPSTACGSWLVPATMASISPASTSLARSRGAVSGIGDGLQRDRQPGRPVTRFVTDLIDRLVQDQRPEQGGMLERVGAARLRVAVAERRLAPARPVTGGGPDAARIGVAR